jgi:hypothetical protein
MNNKRRSNIYYQKNEGEAGANKRVLIQEAFEMHRYYEEKYYSLLMVTYDDDNRHNHMLEEIKNKSEYWRDVYERLVFGQ